MRHTITAAATGLAGLALAGCVEQPAMTETQMPMQPAPGGPPFIQTIDPSVSSAAIESCRATLAAQTQGGVQVVGAETSEAATAIYMRVGANGAPWRCLVSADGSNPSVMFMGSEGAL